MLYRHLLAYTPVKATLLSTPNPVAVSTVSNTWIGAFSGTIRQGIAVVVGNTLVTACATTTGNFMANLLFFDIPSKTLTRTVNLGTISGTTFAQPVSISVTAGGQIVLVVSVANNMAANGSSNIMIFNSSGTLLSSAGVSGTSYITMSRTLTNGQNFTREFNTTSANFSINSDTISGTGITLNNGSLGTTPVHPGAGSQSIYAVDMAWLGNDLVFAKNVTGGGSGPQVVLDVYRGHSPTMTALSLNTQPTANNGDTLIAIQNIGTNHLVVSSDTPGNYSANLLAYDGNGGFTSLPNSGGTPARALITTAGAHLFCYGIGVNKDLLMHACGPVQELFRISGNQLVRINASFVPFPGTRLSWIGAGPNGELIIAKSATTGVTIYDPFNL